MTDTAELLPMEEIARRIYEYLPNYKSTVYWDSMYDRTRGRWVRAVELAFEASGIATRFDWKDRAEAAEAERDKLADWIVRGEEVNGRFIPLSIRTLPSIAARRCRG